MTDRDIQELHDAYRTCLRQAGLQEAMALFPEDILAAIQTAIQARESFDSLVGDHQHD